ncbi:FAD/NAD(P)-binding protein [Sulfitobacter sp. S190]|nr:FAD/NAD(P)-binding protein [Sulfitobacter sp. S190]
MDSLSEAAKRKSAAVELDIFEPAPFPGAGVIYDPNQPDCLVMNYAAEHIDAWTGGRGPSLIDWLSERQTPVSPQACVPRSVVGRYLNWCFSMVLDRLPENLQVNLHKTRVTSVKPTEDGWVLEPGAVKVREVLVTTGHQNWNRRGEETPPRTVVSPFPVNQSLTTEVIPPNSSVTCKGFALTFIDMVLALTEGRGGTFREKNGSFEYVPSGAEPSLIAPFSRSGRPMRPKVDHSRFVSPMNEVEWRSLLSPLLKDLEKDKLTSFQNEVWPALQSIAGQIQNLPLWEVNEIFAHRLSGQFDSARAQREIETGYNIAVGKSAPDLIWFLGEVWRRSYPSLINWIGGRDLSKSDANLFQRVAAEMERIAFGPPASSLGKLICLQKLGMLTFEHISGGAKADCTVNATIPSGSSLALSEPLSQLLEDGHLDTCSLGGVKIDASANACKGQNVIRGLSIIGRSTEGCVLGNDTLSRKLHNHPEQWAVRVLRPYASCPLEGLETTT